MKLSTAAELGLRGILVVADRSEGQPVNLDTICSVRDLPKDYLAKIFGSLVRAELLLAVRGKHGGYRLGRPAEEITVLEVIEAIEGPIALNFCQHDPPKCEEYDCPLRPVWAEMQETLRQRLGEMTLAQYLHCLHTNQARSESPE